MTSRLTEVIVDCHDLARMTQFWCEVLGYEKTNEGDGWVSIRGAGQEPSDRALAANPQPPAVSFVRVPEGKLAKNRVHIDLTPIDRSQTDEVDRVLSLGATRVDIGQGKTPWIVLADPEGNEFCVMPALDPFER